MQRLLFQSHVLFHFRLWNCFQVIMTLIENIENGRNAKYLYNSLFMSFPISSSFLLFQFWHLHDTSNFYGICWQISEKLRFFDPQLKERPEQELFNEPEWLIHLRQLDGQIRVRRRNFVVSAFWNHTADLLFFIVVYLKKRKTGVTNIYDIMYLLYRQCYIGSCECFQCFVCGTWILLILGDFEN